MVYLEELCNLMSINSILKKLVLDIGIFWYYVWLRIDILLIIIVFLFFLIIK